MINRQVIPAKKQTFPDLVFMKGIILEMKGRSFWEPSSSMIIVGKWMSQDRLHYQVYMPHLKIKCFPYYTKLAYDLKSIRINIELEFLNHSRIPQL